MPDLTLSLTITRTELALSALELSDPGNGYEVISVGPGSTSWRREVAKSPWVHGEALVSAVKDVGIAPLSVRVMGTSAAQKETRLGVLLAAFSQFLYTMTVTINGVGYAWACEPADWSVGEDGEFNKFFEMAHRSEVKLSIPRNPVPTDGVL